MTKLHELYRLGQAVWYDNLRRQLLIDGSLQALLDAGVVGVTSNPSIFQKAIAENSDYDEAIRQLALQGKDAYEIYEALALEDIQTAADLLLPIYEDTNGRDGYVSLEVNPHLANETGDTIDEARRLFGALGRPNVMIKVPATQAGVPAVQQLISEGININITLLFANDNYEQIAQAYIDGLEQYAQAGGDLRRVASVASFFVSRVDGMVDEALEQVGNETLQGKIAIANAKVAYGLYEGITGGERWRALAEQGARTQRLLWASTSTKNPAYRDVLYVEELIGPETVNTAPPQTIEAFLDHGRVAITLTENVAEAQAQLAALAELGIDLDGITAQLQIDGVDAFAKPFDSLLESIERKRRLALAGSLALETGLSGHEATVAAALQELRDEEIIERIWARDHTVWQDDPHEITNRLDWLTIATEMESELAEIDELVTAVRGAGYQDVVLLGMGGSSLAPEVFAKTFGASGGYPKLTILDSTDPGAVLAVANAINPAQTLFIVATKTGGTAETLSMFKYFFNQVAGEVGPEQAGQHFIAITDNGSSLADLATKHGFRATFFNNPNIGGRYSALSHFGLVPAALIGVDVRRLLERAQIAALNGGQGTADGAGSNVAAELGTIMGVMAQAGRDKVTFIISPEIAGLGDWIEQLVAESTGKIGRGILPVVGEPVGEPQAYGDDRLFVVIRLGDDNTHAAAITALRAAGQPLLEMTLRDRYDLAAQMFIWELATAVAGARLGIQPFDQPNVEAAKKLARQMIAAYEKEGALPQGETAGPTRDNLLAFLAQARPGDYIAIQAYVQPTAAVDQALLALREQLRDQTGLAVTTGYGPRFLHSTGQLHKGDAGNGLFIQFTADMPVDLPVPDAAGEDSSSISFGTLKTAQALGDSAALREAGRRVIHFHLPEDVAAGLTSLLA